MLGDVKQASKDYMDFLGDCLMIIFKEYFSDIKSESITISEVPNIDEIVIPYFVKQKKALFRL